MRWLVDHSVTNGTAGIEVSKGVYFGLKPLELAAAALVFRCGRG